MRLIDADSFVGFMTALEEAGAEHISFDDLKKFKIGRASCRERV